MADTSQDLLTTNAEHTTLQEVMAATGLTKHGLKRVLRGVIASQASTRPGPRQKGRPAKYLLISTLPEDLRNSIMANREGDTHPCQSAPLESCRLADEKGLFKRTLTIHFQNYRSQKGHGGKGDAVVDFCADYNRGELGTFPAIFRVLGEVSKGKLYRWDLELRTNPKDQECLKDRRGEHRRGKIKDPGIIEIIKPIIYMPNKLPPAQIIRAAERDAKRRGVEVTVCEETIRNYIAKIMHEDAPRVTYFREGRKALFDKHIRHLTQSTEDIDVGSLLTCDGKKLNMELLDFDGKARRMILLTFFDVKSRYPVGFVVTPGGEDVGTLLDALYRAIIRLGKLPSLVHFDNSRAARSRIINGSVDLEQTPLLGVLDQIGVPLSFAKAYNPTGKAHQERWHLTLDEFERFSPSFTGSSIADKPARLARHELFHRKLHEAATGGRIPTIPDFYWAFSWYLDNVYGCCPHSGLKGETPLDVLRRGQGPGFTEQELQHLRTKLLPWIERTIHRDGIKMPWADQLFYSAALRHRPPKEKVIVKYNISEPDRIWVFSKSGDLICEAKETIPTCPAAGHLGTPEQKEEVKRQLADQARDFKEIIGSARELVEKYVMPQVERQQAASGFDKGSVPGTPMRRIDASSLDQGETDAEQPLSADLRAQIAEGVEEFARLTDEQKAPSWEIVKAQPDALRYAKNIQRQMAGQDLPQAEKEWSFWYECTSEFATHRAHFDELQLQAALNH